MIIIPASYINEQEIGNNEYELPVSCVMINFTLIYCIL